MNERPESVRHALIETPLGALTVVAAGDFITGIYFPKHWYPPAADAIGVRVEAANDQLLAAAAVQLNDYLDGKSTTFDLPIATHGDEFQESVWAMLKEIPFGGTTTYGELAERLGNKALAQRVGQAVGRNPLSIVVPCHRVVGADGKLTGFAGGLARKQTLLALEEPEPVRAAKLF
jgi:methylated-DNA-[protein]-cysteine S-methyltransferase